MTDQTQTPQTTEAPPPADAITNAPVTPTEPVQDNSKTSEPKSFLDQLSADNRKAPSLKKFEKGGADALAKSYLELEAKLSSGNKLTLPDKPVSEDPDAWNEVFKRIGRPDKADAYSVVQDNANAVDPLLPHYAEAAHGLGLADAQASGLYNWFQEQTTKMVEEARLEGIDAMKEKWGNDFVPKLSATDDYLSQNTSDVLREKLKRSGIAHDPDFIEFVYNAAAASGEDASFQRGERDPAPQKLPDNPYDKSSPSFNLTRQGQLERNDPKLAQRFMKEANVAGP